MVAFAVCRNELSETGLEPEYVVNTIAFAEQAGVGSVRLYIAQRRRNLIRLEFTAVVSLLDLAIMSRQAQAIAADLHNLAMWEPESATEQ
jgi:hypothetical protein